MTDNEIIKALECCTKGTTSDVCVDCPLRTTDICTEEENGVLKLALDLINRQKAEIESLTGRLESLNKQSEEMKEGNAQLYLRFNTARKKAIKEFAERFLKKVHDNHYLLSDRINSKDYGMFTVGIKQAVNETKEEMAGDAE